MERKLERMDRFFDTRAGSYDHHMLQELKLEVFYAEFQRCINACGDPVSFLDLGCGTGLEIERVFRACPNAKVTGIDLSQGMLDVLQEKLKDYSDRLHLICSSYFDVDFGQNTFDYVISTYSLHHFSPEEKHSLYKRIVAALKPDGQYIEGDYTVQNVEEQEFYKLKNERLRNEDRITAGLFHYDTPLAVDTQMGLFRQAGFQFVDVKKQWAKTSLFICRK